MPERQAPITADENRAECQEERQEGDKGDVQAGDQGEQVTLDRSQSLFYFVPQEKNFKVKLARLCR